MRVHSIRTRSMGKAVEPRSAVHSDVSPVEPSSCRVGHFTLLLKGEG